MMTFNNLPFSVVEPLLSWRLQHIEKLHQWCRIQTSMGVATYQGIKIADKLPSVEALQERIKLLEAQLEQSEG